MQKSVIVSAEDPLTKLYFNVLDRLLEGMIVRDRILRLDFVTSR